MSGVPCGVALNPNITAFANLRWRAGVTSQEAAGSGTTALTLTCRVLNLFYGASQALYDINMGAAPGLRRSSVPSGCGKSTFIKTLNRMNDWVEGCTVTVKYYLKVKYLPGNWDPLALRYRVGMVFNSLRLFQKHFENGLRSPHSGLLQNKAVLLEIVEESLRQAAIWDELKDRLHTSALGLSGGQQQRLCIARTLAAKPSVIP